jgi:hypothetical protein
LYGLKHQKEKRSMDHFAGLDVSVKETSVCIVDDTGKIKIATHARANASSVARRLIAVTECQRITHQPATDVVREKPSSIQPVTPPIIILTGKPNRARRTAALLAPLQCGPAQ